MVGDEQEAPGASQVNARDDWLNRVEVVLGDITRLDVDAIVNAANSSLLGGGGVDGAIHRAAGPELLAVCRTLGGCEQGEAKVTPGFRLRARWVIHTVGPVWAGGAHHEDETLASCYWRSLEVGREVAAKSIAFPAISTGLYGFPRERAMHVALRTVRDYLTTEDLPRRVLFVCFDEPTYEAYRVECARMSEPSLGDSANGD